MTVHSWYDTRSVSTRKSFMMALVDAIEFYVVDNAPASGITYQDLMWASLVMTKEHREDVDKQGNTKSGRKEPHYDKRNSMRVLFLDKSF